jgi:hypothetical protein
MNQIFGRKELEDYPITNRTKAKTCLHQAGDGLLGQGEDVGGKQRDGIGLA